MITALVVDDDFRVAAVHTAFIDSVEGFHVIGVAHRAEEAVRLARRDRPDLVLLDNYLPDSPGVSLLPQLDCDVMMVTADRSAATVRQALRGGVVNYLVKPFDAQTLAGRLRAYARYHGLVRSVRDGELSQDALDRVMQAPRLGDRPPAPKGQSPVTARLIADLLRRTGERLSAADVADRLGIARGTAQRYLAALAADGSAVVGMRYGTTGRPEHEYAWRTSGRRLDR